MPECDICGKTDSLTRTCNYCGATVCSSHTLPEKHDCPSVRSGTGKRFESAFDESVGDERPRKPERDQPDALDSDEVSTAGTGRPAEDLPSSPTVRTTSSDDDHDEDQGSTWRWPAEISARAGRAVRRLKFRSQFVVSTVFSLRFLLVLVLGIATVGQLGLVGVPGLPVDADPAGAVEDAQRAVANVTDDETDNGTSDEANPGADLRGIDPGEVERLFIERLNEEREQRGVGTVERWETLSEMGRNHSRSMAEHDYVGFEEPDGADTSDRYAERGLLPGCRLDVQGTNRYYEGVELVYQTYVYEDVEASWADGGTYLINSEEDFARVLFESWMNSADNQNAMLVYSAKRAGLGIEVTDSGKAYATLELC